MASGEHGGLLRAVIDCIIPADEFPSASGNKVDVFIERITQGELHDFRANMLAGLAETDAAAVRQFGSGFVAIPADQRNAVLAKIEVDPQWADWFSMMIRLTHEGYYADRSNGGNPDHISWKMVGYDPRLGPGAH